MSSADRTGVLASTPFHAAGKVIVVTGGASGIGLAMARRFLHDGAATVVIADRRATAVQQAAEELGAQAMVCDVSEESQTRRLINDTEAGFGPIDLFCANAGVSVDGGEQLPDSDWQQLWQVNVMAIVHAARALIPTMLARGGGHFLVTASAAGLLSQSDAPYAVTKHAALSFAEWLSIMYGARGLGVSCLCPLGVDTPLFRAEPDDKRARMSERVLAADEVADSVAVALREGRFLILSHEETRGYVERRALDRERWLRGMRKLQGQS